MILQLNPLIHNIASPAHNWWGWSAEQANHHPNTRKPLDSTQTTPEMNQISAIPSNELKVMVHRTNSHTDLHYLNSRHSFQEHPTEIAVLPTGSLRLSRFNGFKARQGSETSTASTCEVRWMLRWLRIRLLRRMRIQMAVWDRPSAMQTPWFLLQHSAGLSCERNCEQCCEFVWWIASC